MTENSLWQPSPISSDDERLIDAYVTIGRSVDDLPYSEEFERLAKLYYQREATREEMRFVFRRLLGLRKRAVLPRTTASSLSVG